MAQATLQELQKEYAQLCAEVGEISLREDQTREQYTNVMNKFKDDKQARINKMKALEEEAKHIQPAPASDPKQFEVKQETQNEANPSPDAA